MILIEDFLIIISFLYCNKPLQKIINQAKMKSQKVEAFLKSTREDIPSMKLVKYRFFIQGYPQQALTIKDQMLKIVLQNKLLGEYRAIHQALKINVHFSQNYQSMNQLMVAEIDPIHGQQKVYQAEQNTQSLAQTYVRLGQKYFFYGDYKNAIQAFDHLHRLNSNSHQVKYQSYANQYALALYYKNQYQSLTRFNSRPIQKSLLQKMPDLCIIRDLNNLELRKNLSQPFKNITQMKFSNLELSRNRVMSYSDLGFLYSLLSIAYMKKDKIVFTKWSYKLQNLFLNNKYKVVLQVIQKQKQVRCFLPIIRKNYETLQSLIRKRILIQVISSFDRCPFSIIQQMTGINEGQVRIFVKNNSEIPLYFDNVTASVVYKRTTTPLFKEVNKLYLSLKSKYDEEIASLSNRFQDKEDDDDQDIGGLDRKRSGGRMGGMGRLSGMGMGGMGGMGMGMGMGRRF